MHCQLTAKMQLTVKVTQMWMCYLQICNNGFTGFCTDTSCSVAWKVKLYKVARWRVWCRYKYAIFCGLASPPPKYKQRLWSRCS